MAFQIMYLLLVITALYSGACRAINDNMTYGVYTFFGDQLLPSFVSLNVTLNGTLLCMNLERNVDMTHDIPMYALSKDNKGLYHTEKVQMDKKKVFAVYIDSSQLAAFRIVQETDKNGKSRMFLEGILHSKGKIYHLKNTNQFKKTIGEEQNVTKDMKTNRTENDQINNDVFYFQELDHISTTQNDALFKSIHSPNQGRIFENKVFTLPHLRQKRQVTQDVNIDVVAVVDFAVYSRWYNYSTPDPNTETQEQSTFNEIRQYYSLVFNGVNMLYKTITELPYTIHVRVSGIIVSTSASSSPWTEQYRQRDTPWDKVDAHLALGFFKEWVPKFMSVLRSDHMVLFTGYNMITTANNETSDSITGLAWVGTACETDGTSSSLVEDLGGFQVIRTVTHELGHSLSAHHDGTENSCEADDRYIMSPGYSNRTEENKLNPWRFSSCSPDYFNTYIARQVLTEQGRECMYDVTLLPDITLLLPGQVYNATEQCRLRYGPHSYVCQDVSNWNLSDVCINMYCSKPDSSLCYYLETAQGTSCGNKKWCVDGLCTYSNEAPAIDDDCIFGDDGNQAPLSRPCSSLVSEFPGNCYNSLINRKCCQSCSALRNTKPNVTVVCEEEGIQRQCTSEDITRVGLCNGGGDINYNFENPCTPSNLANGVLRHPYPYDSTKFLHCDLHGNVYVTACPNGVAFNTDSLHCGFNSPLNKPFTARLHQIPEYSNQCTISAIARHHFYFPYAADSTKFIQCDAWGTAFLMTCAPGTEWSQNDYACVHQGTIQRPTVTCTRIGEYLPDPCNHHDFLECDKNLQPKRSTCGPFLFFNPNNFLCDTTDVQPVGGC